MIEIRKLSNYFKKVLLSLIILIFCIFGANLLGMNFIWINKSVLAKILLPLLVLFIILDFRRLTQLVNENFKKNIFLVKYIKYPMLIIFFVFLLQKFISHQSSLDWVTVCFLVGWVINVVLHKFSSRISIGLALIFLFLCPFFILLKLETYANESANLAYLFIAFAVFQQLTTLFINRKVVE